MNFLKKVGMNLKDPVFLVSVIVVVILSSLLIVPWALKGWYAAKSKFTKTAAVLVGALMLLLSGADARAAALSESAGGVQQGMNPWLLVALIGVALLFLAFKFGVPAIRRLFASSFFSSVLGGAVAVTLLAVIGGGFVMNTATARDTVLKYFANSLVMFAGKTDIEAGTNGFFTLYFPNGTNYIRLGTNGAFSVYGSTKTWSGYTGTILLTNALGGGFVTQDFFGGILVGTNHTVAPAP